MDTQVKENTGILFQVTKEAVKEYHRQEDRQEYSYLSILLLLLVLVDSVVLFNVFK